MQMNVPERATSTSINARENVLRMHAAVFGAMDNTPARIAQIAGIASTPFVKFAFAHEVFAHGNAQ